MKNSSEKEAISLDLRPKQRLFLKYYFKGKGMAESVKAAGYRGKSTNALCNTGRSIIKRYVSYTGHREIFREAGLGEVEIAGELRQLLEASKKAKDRKSWSTALNIASKCLGMQREAIESDVGAQIIINTGSKESKKEPQKEAQGGNVVSLAAMD